MDVQFQTSEFVNFVKSILPFYLGLWRRTGRFVAILSNWALQGKLPNIGIIQMSGIWSRITNTVAQFANGSLAPQETSF